MVVDQMRKDITHLLFHSCMEIVEIRQTGTPHSAVLIEQKYVY